jgi:hypothetical protein
MGEPPSLPASVRNWERKRRLLDASKADELEHAVAAFDAINGIVNWNRVASASRLR